MNKILIGDHLIHPNDIESISERDVTLNVKKEKPNPKPKPSGFFSKLVYSDTVTVTEAHTYHVLVLKVAAGTQTVRPEPDDDSDFTIGRSFSGTRKLYKFYTIGNNANLIKDAKELKKELDKLGYGELYRPESTRRDAIIEMLQDIGMEMSYGSWTNPNHLDTSVMIDNSIRTKQDFIDKYI